ncbi:hypothetical protein LIER_43743 [Lithospermum erythrorhizon]|uniref:Uncharacterized protein n=1 Tax=Lithospermum erythrorhizon TaxID=34254 RepID=A0AAV3QT66_LITER
MAGDGVGEPPPTREGGGEPPAAPVCCVSTPSQPKTLLLSSSIDRRPPAPAASTEGGQAITSAPYEVPPEVPPQPSMVPLSVNPKPYTQAQLSFVRDASPFNGDPALPPQPKAPPHQPPAQPPQPSPTQPAQPRPDQPTQPSQPPIVQPHPRPTPTHKSTLSSSGQEPSRFPSYDLGPQNLPWNLQKPPSFVSSTPAETDTYNQENTIFRCSDNAPHAIINPNNAPHAIINSDNSPHAITNLQPTTKPDHMHASTMHKPSYAETATGLNFLGTAEESQPHLCLDTHNLKPVGTRNGMPSIRFKKADK